MTSPAGTRLRVVKADDPPGDPPSTMASRPPMRIAMIAPPWIPVPPPSYGGTEIVVDALCRGLRAAGHEVLLVASGDSTCPVERAALHPVSLGTEVTSTTMELAHAAFGYERARDWGADVVHDHTVSGPALGATCSGLPVVTTNHGPFAGDLAVVYRSLSWEVPLIAISRAQAATALGCRVAAVIHHGVDVDAYSHRRSGGTYALFVGRMSADKGVHVAVEAARIAGMPLLIAAKMREPAEREYFETRVRPHLGAGVEYVGEVDRAKQIELLAGASCLLNPIQWDEPFGMVAIEALAAGVPVVATAFGAMPEIVEDGRSGFIRSSVEELAAAVWLAAELDPAECRRRAEDCFSMRSMAANHARFYGVVHDAVGVGRPDEHA